MLSYAVGLCSCQLGRVSHLESTFPSACRRVVDGCYSLVGTPELEVRVIVVMITEFPLRTKDKQCDTRPRPKACSNGRCVVNCGSHIGAGTDTDGAEAAERGDINDGTNDSGTGPGGR